MFNFVGHVEAQRLLAEVAAVEAELSPNELELFRSLIAKYAEPGVSHFDDAACLELLLRNVQIRRGYGLDARKDTGRRIDLPRKQDTDS